MTLNKTIKRNISKTSKGRYRVRLSCNGKLYEKYLPKLKEAIEWRNAIRMKHTN